MKTTTKIFRFGLLLLLFLFILPSELWAQKEKNATYWLEMALEENDIERKIEYYQRALRINPDDPETHNNLGILYKNKKLYTEAIAEYQAALSSSSYRTQEYAHHNLGVVYKEMEKYEKALEHFKSALEIKPKFAKAYNGMGLAYKGLGEFEKATESFRRALEIEPDYIQAEYNLKNVWKLSSKKTPTEKKTAKLYNQGVSLAKQGKYTQAIATLEEALRLKPGRIKIKQKLRELRRRREFRKWHKAALREIDAGRRSKSHEHHKEALKELDAGRWSKAHEHLEKALKLAADRDEVQKITRLQEQIAESLRREKKGLRAAWLYQQGLLKLESKDWLGAISDFTKLLMLDPEHKGAKVKNRLARIGYYYEEALRNINQSKWKAAEEHLQNLLSLEPEHAGAKDELSKVRKHLHSRRLEYALEKGAQAFNLGEWKLAERFYQEVLRLSPDNQTAKDRLNQVQEALYGKSKALTRQATAWDDWAKPLVVIGLLLAVLSLYYILANILRSTHFLNYHHQFRDSDESRVLYEKMLQEDPKRRAVYPLLAKTYHELGQAQNVENLLQRCEEYSRETPEPETTHWILCRGEIYQALHQLKKAAQQMEQALSRQPGQAKTREKLKQLYQTMLKEQDNPEIAARLARLQAPLSVASDELEGESAADKEKKKLTLLKECFGRNEG